MLRRMEHVGPATTTRETGVDGGCGFRYRSAACAWGRDPDRIVPVFAEMLSPGRQQVLDVGCGEGRNALWLAGAGITVHAVDIDAEALGRADQKWSTAGRIRLTFQRWKNSWATMPAIARAGKPARQPIRV